MSVDRQQLAGQLAIARSMSVAALPVDDDEPEGSSAWWFVGLVKVLSDAQRQRDIAVKRDLLVLAGGHLLGWIEACDRRLNTAANRPE